MGLPKIQHIRELLSMPDVNEQFTARYQRCLLYTSRRPIRTVQRGTPNDRRYRPADGRTPEPELPSEDELYQQSSEPVSYTHLDVYKRQGPQH